MTATTMRTEVLIVGGGLGGVAAALAAVEGGASVVLVEGDRWLGGQLTAQAVPSDEHMWSEQFGITASYRRLRDGIRRYYRDHYPLTAAARSQPWLNPGGGFVSPLCHEPRVGVDVIEAMLAPWRASGRLTILQPHRLLSAEADADFVRAVTIVSEATGGEVVIEAAYVLDATETGELLPAAGVEYVTGFESTKDSGEPSAPDEAQPANFQGVSWCFAMDHVDGNHTIDRPATYDHWRAARPANWTGPLFSLTAPDPRTGNPAAGWLDINPDGDPHDVAMALDREPGGLDLWRFRRIAARNNFEPGYYASDITLVNWPQIDYFEGLTFAEESLGVSEEEAARNREAARQLSLSALYWLQTEVPRPDGDTGYPGLRLRPDIMGTTDGLAQDLYVRESRRIKAVRTVTENDVSLAIRGDRGATQFADSVGIGMYRIDLHPSTGGDPYIDVASAPFQIPLAALLPQRVRNVLPAAKNIGTTHITNGCYRLHPIEWNIGEAAGALAAMSVRTGVTPHQVSDSHDLTADFQRLLTARGVELSWPDVVGY